jgi:hypothetical protein
MIVLKNRTETIYVWKNINLERSRLLLFFTILVLAFMLFILNTRPFSQLGLLLIPISYGLGVYTYRKMVVWGMGAHGEKKVIKELSRLGDSYFLLNNVVVPPNWGDADHIVLGPNGLFVVETKTVGDTVECDGDSWRRLKVSKSGFSYPVPVGNPGGQAKRNAKSLKDLLLKHEFDIFRRGAPHIWVHAIVCFTNEEVELRVRNPTIEVLKLPALVEYIRIQSLDRAYSVDELRRMGEVILRECD